MAGKGKTFPEVGESAEAAAYVWSRAPKIVDAFDRGVVIRSARGLFLAIPTPAAEDAEAVPIGVEQHYMGLQQICADQEARLYASLICATCNLVR